MAEATDILNDEMRPSEVNSLSFKAKRCLNCGRPSHTTVSCLEPSGGLPSGVKGKIKKDSPLYNEAAVKKHRVDLKHRKGNIGASLQLSTLNDEEVLHDMQVLIGEYRVIQDDLAGIEGLLQVSAEPLQCHVKLLDIQKKLVGFFHKKILAIKSARSLKNFLTQNSKKKTFTDGEARYENLMASAKTLNDISVELKEKVEKLLSQAFKITNRASKLQLFRNNLAILKDRRRNEIVGSHDIVVARETVLIDSFSRLGGLDGKFWREFFSIKFEGELGFGKGVKREWYSALAQQIVDPSFGFFKMDAKQRYEVNPDSSANQDAESNFRFIGKFLAKSILDEVPLPVKFCPVLLKLLLGECVQLVDFELKDPVWAASLKDILLYKLEDLAIELFFTVPTTRFGEDVEVSLLPNNVGHRIAVTEENKAQYVEKLIDFKLYKQNWMQIKSIMMGFNSVIPQHFVKHLDYMDMELLLSGVLSINVDEWRQFSTYSGFDDNPQQIEHFWQIVHDMGEMQKSKLLRFATGSTRPPAGGFQAMDPPFKISRTGDGEMGLPSSSTCFNLLKLRGCGNLEQMKKFLHLAIEETDSFEFS